MATLRLLILTACIAILNVAGCKSDSDPASDQLNEYWREGYGYNNPNVDRMRKGLPPQNFDGSQ